MVKKSVAPACAAVLARSLSWLIACNRLTGSSSAVASVTLVEVTRLLMSSSASVRRDTAIEVRERADGEWWIQGTTLAQLRELNRGAPAPSGEIEIVGEDVEIALFRLGAEELVLIDVSRGSVLRDERRTAINANLRLPASMGRQLTVSATQLDNEDPRERYWDITVAGRGLELPGWTALVEDRIATLASGSASVDLSLRVGGRGIREVAVEFAAVAEREGIPDLIDRIADDIGAKKVAAAAISAPDPPRQLPTSRISPAGSRRASVQRIHNRYWSTMVDSRTISQVRWNSRSTSHGR